MGTEKLDKKLLSMSRSLMPDKKKSLVFRPPSSLVTYNSAHSGTIFMKTVAKLSGILHLVACLVGHQTLHRGHRAVMICSVNTYFLFRSSRPKTSIILSSSSWTKSIGWQYTLLWCGSHSEVLNVLLGNPLSLVCRSIVQQVSSRSSQRGCGYR